jgi:predicted nucleic acid-binding protein
MKILLDTNVIIRAAQPNLPIWPTIDSCLTTCVARNHTLCLVPQTIYEFWVALTRPASQNGFGLTPNDAMGLLQNTISNFALLLDERGIFHHWITIVEQFAVSGKGGHDARIVAAMQRHSITSLISYNKDDFKRYPIAVWTPAEIVDGAQFD